LSQTGHHLELLLSLAATPRPRPGRRAPTHPELQVEVERLKLLVAELLLDKRMLQDVAKEKW
jgi:hypothetical protein